MNNNYLRIALGVLLALALAGCGGKSALTPGEPQPQQPAGPRTQQSQRYRPQRGAPERKTLSPEARAAFASRVPAKALAALQHFGAPGARSASAVRTTSVVLPYQVDATQQYSAGDAGWIRQANAVDNGPFSLELAPSGPDLPAALAYSMYRFDALDVEPGRVAVYTPGTGVDIGLAAYNWTEGRWELLEYGSDVNFEAQFPFGIDFIDASDDLGLVVFSITPNSVEVNALELLPSAPPNEAPVAWLEVDDPGGIVPHNVTLDASNSYDIDGTIVEYLFDAEGTGTWTSNGANPIYNFTYTSSGIFWARLRVVDDLGVSSSVDYRDIFVHPGTYDEVEDNDSPATANPLPAFPLVQFTGNVGDLGAYDGDTTDYFSFNAGVGDQVSIQLLFDWSTGWAGVNLWDSDGDFLASNWGTTTYEFQPGDTAPYIIEVYGGGDTNYWLNVYPTIYHEWEPNDDPSFANWTYFPLSGFRGSLGSAPGYPGYDGDGEDWFAIDCTPGSILDITLTNPGTGDFDLALYDSSGTLLAFAATGGPTETLNYTFQPGDQPDFHLVVEAASGYGDYTLDGTLFVGGGENYDEVENNDSLAQPNMLPARPFSGFRGNIGDGGAYDGDWEDFFELSGAVGERIEIVATFNPSDAGLDLYMLDANWNTMGSGQQTGPGEVSLKASVRSLDTGPFYLIVSAIGDSTDYQLAGGTWDTYDEVEDNDVQASANPLPNLDDMGWFNNFWGSIGTGPGYTGYDGDLIDWYTFNASVGDNLYFSIDFEPTTATATLKLYDSDGDLLASSTGLGGYESLNYQVQGGDTSPFYIVVEDPGGYSDYRLAGDRWVW